MSGSSYFEQISTTDEETHVAPAVLLASAAVFLALFGGIVFRLVVFLL